MTAKTMKNKKISVEVWTGFWFSTVGGSPFLLLLLSAPELQVCRKVMQPSGSYEIDKSNCKEVNFDKTLSL